MSMLCEGKGGSLMVFADICYAQMPLVWFALREAALLGEKANTDRV